MSNILINPLPANLRVRHINRWCSCAKFWIRWGNIKQVVIISCVSFRARLVKQKFTCLLGWAKLRFYGGFYGVYRWSDGTLNTHQLLGEQVVIVWLGLNRLSGWRKNVDLVFHSINNHSKCQNHPFLIIVTISWARKIMDNFSLRAPVEHSCE